MLPRLPCFPTTVSPTHAPDPSLHGQQQPSPGIAPQSLSSSSQPPRPPGDLPSWLGFVWLRQGLSAFTPLGLPQVRCFALSLKCFSSDSNSCPDAGIRPLLWFPHPQRAGPVLLTPLFALVPSSYRVLRGSVRSVPPVRSPRPRSDGVLHARLSEGVFLMCPWREMYSTSTHSSSILFLSRTPFLCFFVLLFWKIIPNFESGIWLQSFVSRKTQSQTLKQAIYL